MVRPARVVEGRQLRQRRRQHCFRDSRTAAAPLTRVPRLFASVRGGASAEGFGRKAANTEAPRLPLASCLDYAAHKDAWPRGSGRRGLVLPLAWAPPSTGSVLAPFGTARMQVIQSRYTPLRRCQWCYQRMAVWDRSSDQITNAWLLLCMCPHAVAPAAASSACPSSVCSSVG